MSPYRVVVVHKKVFVPSMRVATKVMFLISLLWPAISEANISGTAAEAEPSLAVFH